MRGFDKNITATSKINSNMEVVGYVKPNAGTKDILDNEYGIGKLTNRDCVIVCGGKNDISKNNASDAVRNLVQFVKCHNNTNLMVISAPHRHDLIESSCVNKEVKSFNIKLKEKMNRFKNVTMIDVNLERNGFTRHGLHMNNRGKEILSREIAEKLSGLWTTATIKPIIMIWKDKILSSKEADVAENLEITENNLTCDKTVCM